MIHLSLTPARHGQAGIGGHATPSGGQKQE